MAIKSAARFAVELRNRHDLGNRLAVASQVTPFCPPITGAMTYGG